MNISSYKVKIAVTIIGLLILAIIYLTLTRRNQSSPYPDVIFIQDRPGANGRHISYTPVLRDNTSVKVGPNIGADYGRIYFKDLNGDGTKETIIETQLPLIDTGEYYTHTKEVLSYSKLSDGTPRIKSIESSTKGSRIW